MPTVPTPEAAPTPVPGLLRAAPILAFALLTGSAMLAGCGGGTPAAPPPPPSPPTVSSVTPTHGSLGTLVNLSGQGFGTDPAAVQVTFKAPAQGTMTVTPTMPVAGSLQVLVPAALAETAQLTVTVGGLTSAPVPFTIDALADPTPGGATEAQAFLSDVDGILGRLLPVLDATLVPLLQEAGQPADAASVRSGLATLRGAFADAVAANLASKTPAELAVIDAFFASPAAAAAKQELAALLLELPAPPAPAVGQAAGTPRPHRAASAGSGIMQGFDSGTVDSILKAKLFLVRARAAINRLDNALIVAIAACTAGTAIVGPEATALAATLEGIRETLVKPLLEILDVVIKLMDTAPTRVAGGTLRIQVTDHLLYNDQEFGSMEAPYAAGDSGVLLVTEPYGVKGYVTFKNDGGASLRSTGADLVPSLGLVMDALMALTGIEIGALEVTDAPCYLNLISSDPTVVEGTWSDPSFWITGLKPGLVDVTLRVGMAEVQESCPLGIGGPDCIPASEAQVTRAMRVMAGLQATGPFTQGPRLFSVQAAGQPPATAFLGEELDVTGEGFSTNPQLAPQDVYLEPAPGYPLSGVAGSPYESFNRYESFKFVLPDALPGAMTVVLNGSPSNPIDFTVLPPLLDAPPPSAIVGEYQRFTGKGFSEYGSHNQGDWNGFRLTAEDGGHAWLDFTVPGGATSGPFKVVTLGALHSNEHPVVVRRFSEPALLSGGGRLALRPAVAFDRQSGQRIAAWVERGPAGGLQLVASVLAPGAATAGTPVVLPARLGGHPAAPPRPAVAAASGWLHVAWVERAPGPSSIDQVVTARSQDGLAWSTPTVLSTGPRPARQPALGADGDLLFAAWIDEAAIEGQAGVLRIARSADAGASFGARLQWSGAGDMSDPVVAVRGQAAVIAWSAEETSGRAVLAMRSEDDGLNFQPAWRVGAPDGTGGLARHPSVAIGPSCVVPLIASVYLAWEQSLSPDYVEEVQFVRFDGLATPATPINVSQSPGHSQSPQVVVDDDCIPALAWLELGHSRQRLLDTEVGRVAATPLPAELLFARSFDGGATFNPRRMTLAKNTLGDRLGHLAMAGGGQALFTLVHQDDFGGAAVAIRTTDGDGGAPAAQPPAPAGEVSADLVYRSQGGAMWVSAPDGRWLQRLNRSFGGLSAPGLSPDGRHMAWVPITDQTWVAEADGAHALRISATADFVWAGHTSWSPRGDWLSVGSPWVPQKLGWIRPDSTGFALVGTASAPTAFGASGTQPWSPGGRIVFAGSGALRTLDPSSGAVSNLAPAAPGGFPGIPTYPSWSPDGSRLAMVLAADPGQWAVGSLGTGDLYVYDVVLGTLTQLTAGGHDTTPTWSPDGTRLAFGRVEGAGRTVGVKRADTGPGDELILTNPFIEDDSEPAWQPEGHAVLVVRRDLAGTQLTLTSLDASSGAPTLLAASPAGKAAVQHLGQRPTWPTGAGATAGATDATSVALSWTPATDDTGVVSYQVWNGDTLVLDQIPAAGASAIVSGLAASTGYTFTIRACDAAGNCSLTGPSVSVTTTTASGRPSWSVIPPVLAHGSAWSPGSWYDTPYSVTVNWTPATEPGVEYRVFLDGAATPAWTFPESTFDMAVLDGLRPLATYTFTLQACFVASQACTTDGPSLTVTTPEDTSPPYLQSADVLGVAVTLQYSEPLDPASTPAVGDFAVTVLDGLGTPVPRAIQAVAVLELEKKVVLTLVEPVVVGERAAVSYLPGSAPLRNTGGLDAPEVAGQPLQNGSVLNVMGIAGTPSGEVVVVGSMAGAARLGTTLLQCSSAYDGFVARRSAAGQWLWARQLGGAGFDELRGVAVDAAGAIYVAGAFSGALTLTGPGGPITLTPNGAADALVAKLDASGAWQWAARAGGAGSSLDPGPGSDAFNGGFAEMAQSVAVDGAGNVYVAGKFVFTATFGGAVPALTSAGDSELWVGKLDASGAWQWASAAHSVSGAGVANAVASDGTAVFVTGAFLGTLEFPGLPQSFIDASTGLVLARLDAADGRWLWATDGDDGSGSLQGGSGQALAVDGTGGVIVGGAKTTSVGMYGPTWGPYVARWGGDGAPAWSQRGTGSARVLGLALDADGSLYAGGSFSGSLGFGGSGLPGNTYGDTFAARLSAADGGVTWTLVTGNAGSSASASPVGAALCGAGRLCLAGSVIGWSPGATYQFGPFTRQVETSDLFVATAGNTADVPPLGTWLGLGGMEDAP